ncbi:MAG: enoyl-CoA hydratase/isomerase family protein [Bacteroidetes bacterium]|nr:enoyl-CoA hydratase/isomerase family protein [Bacteroidota bacterium]
MSVITSQHINKVLKISLNRPDKANSFNREMALALQQELDKAAADKTVRAILLTGSGKAFCAGQDLAEATNMDAATIEKFVREHYNPIVLKIRALEKPVVCAVNGVAAGAGANIAFACDLVMASSTASFIQSFSKIGLIPDSGGTFFLPRLVGLQKATAMTFLAEKISASEAVELGLIYKSIDENQLETESLALATKLSNMPTKGLALTKKLLNQSFNNTLNEQLNQEAFAQVEAGLTADSKEAINAFLEKREPNFKGE